FGGVLLLAHNWADWAATKRSYELMARHVHPHFQRNANALRDWSYADAKSKYETAGAQSQAAVQAAIDKHQRRKACCKGPMSAFGGKADIASAGAFCLLMTQSGQRRD